MSAHAFDVEKLKMLLQSRPPSSVADPAAYLAQLAAAAAEVEGWVTAARFVLASRGLNGEVTLSPAMREQFEEVAAFAMVLFLNVSPESIAEHEAEATRLDPAAGNAFGETMRRARVVLYWLSAKTLPQLWKTLPQLWKAARSRIAASPRELEEFTMIQHQIEGLDSLGKLDADWDGEGAPAPSAWAMRSARDAFWDLSLSRLAPDEIEADVNGGVALLLYAAKSARRVWVRCPNEGEPKAVLHGDPELGARSIPLSAGWERSVADYLEPT